MDEGLVARRALACLDLTSLNDDDTPARIDALCDRAFDPALGAARPAAVCVFPRFVAQCARRLGATSVRLATVANFPGGAGSLDEVIDEVEDALRAGAQEIDVVLPYRDYLAGRSDVAMGVVREVCEQVHQRRRLVKLILETGALGSADTIRAVARDAVDAGVDFLKTSTGKLEPGATPDAARALLEVIVEAGGSGRKVGLKVSGGVRTVADAALYLTLADQHLGEVTSASFRIGASGLLDDIVRVLSGTGAGNTDRSGY